VGWRTPALPTAGGTKLSVNLDVRGKDIQAEKNPVVGFMDLAGCARTGKPTPPTRCRRSHD
jgi:hypothetical protein